jgi:hypothetical protein
MSPAPLPAAIGAPRVVVVVVLMILVMVVELLLLVVLLLLLPVLLFPPGCSAGHAEACVSAAQEHGSHRLH